jgi:DNA polymerase III alpha subunit
LVYKEELDHLAKTPCATAKAIAWSRGARIRHATRKIPNQRSMHSCGIIISEEPIYELHAFRNASKGFPNSAFDMHVAEAIG